jgi:poly(A) polymerase
MSRYNYDFDPGHTAAARPAEKPPPEYQRIILTDILTGMFPWKGMQFLADCGLLDVLWPELSGLDKTDHSKEFHPEGNVWEHSLESFRYRKVPDLTLTLALLLHDAGKPSARKSREKAFDGHAEIGARIARKFLRRLVFPESIVSDVVFLVKHHMIPGAMQRLPLYRTEKLMSKEIFPLLLELYRCDLSSTYRGPDGFYRACKIYRNFLRYRKNPYRTNEGKKLARLYVESH